MLRRVSGFGYCLLLLFAAKAYDPGSCPGVYDPCKDPETLCGNGSGVANTKATGRLVARHSGHMFWLVGLEDCPFTAQR